MLGRLLEGGSVECTHAGGAPVCDGLVRLGGGRPVRRHHLRFAFGDTREARAQGVGDESVQRLAPAAQKPGVGGLLQKRVGELEPRPGTGDGPQHALRGEQGERRVEVRDAERRQRLEQLALELATDHRRHVDHVAEIRKAVEPLGQEPLERWRHGRVGDRLRARLGQRERLEHLLHEQRDTIGRRLDPGHDPGIRLYLIHRRDHLAHLIGAERAELDRDDLAAIGPGRRELAPEGEHAQGGNAPQTGDDPIQQLDRRWIGPVKILDREQHRAPGPIADQDRFEHAQGRAPGIPRCEIGPLRVRHAVDRQQVSEQGHRLSRVEPGLASRDLEDGTLMLGRLAAIQPQPTLEIADHRIQRRGLVVRGALPHLLASDLLAQVFDQRAHQAALADPRLTADLDDLTAALGCALPCVLDDAQFAVAADHRGQRAPTRDLEAAHRPGRPQHPVGADRPGHPLQRLLAQRLGLEVALDQRLRGVADDDRVGLGDRLQARRDVGHLTDDLVHRGRLSGTHLARHHHACVQADPDPQDDVARFAKGGVELDELVEDAEGRVHGPLGVVLVRPRVSEVGDDAVADVTGHEPAHPLDRADAGVLVGTQNVSPLLRIEPLSQRGRADEVAEQRRDIAALGGVAGIGRDRADRLGAERRAAATAEPHACRTLQSAATASHVVPRPPNTRLV